MPFVISFFHISMIFSRFMYMVVYNCLLSLRLNNIPLYKIAHCSFIFQLMGIWMVVISLVINFPQQHVNMFMD